MNNIINYKDNRYIVKRKIKINPEEELDYWKSMIPHDIVLKQNGIYWFLNEITEVYETKD